ncbi:hemerythrin domain-containing protein [Streptomyces sp. 7-21]|uniref:hemerythrin domain-containing protein n=1 Tax=Streptomyces sp. 7-21 TaxID=2802283 RepID=UPI00191EE739|nr:hemerythrin domain-containing protein [Streptomyces sp. 7-21]MBL1065838.1 hemerythrin domain-containing protein [Streptomyces sp. 7-21]
MTDDARTDAAGGQDDVVALLMRQHGDIRNLFDDVERASGDERRDRFRELVRLLAVHETAEEEIVHPAARGLFDGAEQVVEERLTEERGAKERLKDLDEMDPGDPDFLPRLRTLREEVMKHARAEERYEFLHLRRYATPEQLAAMASAIRAAEATAPTRPHPGVESAAANVAVGPFAAVLDRARDAVRRGKSSGN